MFHHDDQHSASRFHRGPRTHTVLFILTISRESSWQLLRL